MSLVTPRKGYKSVPWLFGKEIEIPQEWEVKKINELAKVNSEQINNDFKYDEIEYVDISSIEQFQITKLDKYSTSERPSRAQRIIKNKDIIISTVRPYMKSFSLVHLNKPNLICSTGFTVVQSKINSDTNFLFNYFKSYLFESNYFRKMEGMAYPAITSSVVSNSLILIPNDKKEREKIATILSNVDNLIESTGQVIETSKRVKTGLMQKLLTRGIGHTKFKKVPWLFGKEIEIPQEWEIKKLKESCTVRQGLQIPISDRFTEDGKNRFQYITVKAIHSNKFNEYVENPSERVICTTEDILFTRTGNTGEIITDIKGVFHNNFFLVDFDKRQLFKEFLIISLKQHKIQGMIKSLAGTTTIPDLNHGDFFRLQIIIPPLPEQQKIATILSNIDSKITSQEQYKEKLEKLKKSLMQKLLTGEVRV